MYCTRQTISNYENGKSEPNIALLVEIAKVLEVEVNDLIYGPKKKENRRGQKIRSAAAFAAACTLLVAIEILTPFAKQYGWKNFEIAPLYLLRYVLRPLVLALFGWGIAEAAEAFAGIRLWEGRTERIVKAVRIVFLYSGCYFDSVCRTGVVDGSGLNVYLVAVGTNAEGAGQFLTLRRFHI